MSEVASESLQNIIEVARTAAVVTDDFIKDHTTATTLRSAQNIITSNDISAFTCTSFSDYILVSGLVHRKQHAQIYFITKVHLPLEELSTRAEFWCACPFSSPNLFCSHAAALLLLVSEAQLRGLIQPMFDKKCWRPKKGHALCKLPFIQEMCLPWEQRIYLMISTQPEAAPDRRHASLMHDRVVQTYFLEKERKRKRGRASSLEHPAQMKTTSWSVAVRCSRMPIRDSSQAEPIAQGANTSESPTPVEPDASTERSNEAETAESAV